MLELIEALKGMNGVSALVMVLAVQLVFSVVKFLWGLYQKKEKANDTRLTSIDLNVAQIRKSQQEDSIKIQLIEREVGELMKLKGDVQTAFAAIKAVAGNKWPTVKKKLSEDRL